MKPQFTWDPEVLLCHLIHLGDNDLLTLRDLTLKLVALLMLLSGQRVHCVHSFSTVAMDVTTNSYTFYPTVLLKHSRQTFRGKPIVFRSYPHRPELCVIRTLNEYIRRTSTLRSTEALLITHRKPHGKAHRDTVARWLKQALNEAGITQFTAHSCRGAGTSYAHKTANLTVKDILNQGQWTRESTWFKFYKKDILNPVITVHYGTQILNAYCKRDTIIQGGV